MCPTAEAVKVEACCAGGEGEQPGEVEDGAADGGHERHVAAAPPTERAGGGSLGPGARAAGDICVPGAALGGGVPVGESGFFTCLQQLLARQSAGLQ